MPVKQEDSSAGAATAGLFTCTQAWRASAPCGPQAQRVRLKQECQSDHDAVRVASDGSASAAAAGSIPSSTLLKRILEVNTFIAALRTHDGDFLRAIERAQGEHDALQLERYLSRAGARASISEILERVTVLLDVMKRADAQRENVRVHMDAAENELNELVNAPVSGGRDPTEWLSDELMVMIIVMLPLNMMWVTAHGCGRVCRRWARLLKDESVKHALKVGRWAAYEAGLIRPRAPIVMQGAVGVYGPNQHVAAFA
jgi:hypothetical protein